MRSFTNNSSKKLSLFFSGFMYPPLVLSIAINAIIYLLLFLLFTPRFETVDDVILMMFSSGCLTSLPSDLLVYTSIGIGKLLKILYSLQVGLNWYPIYLYSVNFVALTVILYVILKLQKNIFGLLMFLCLYFLFFFNFFMLLQYTISSLLIGTAGFFLFYYSLNHCQDHNKKKWWFFAIAVLLVIISGLIRLQAIKAVVLLSGMILTIKYLRGKRHIIIAFLLISFLGYIGIEMSEHWYYKTYSGIPKFKEFIEAIENIEDNPNMVNEEILKKVGLRTVDYHIIKSHLYVDPNVFSIDRMIALGDSAFKPRSVKSTINELNIAKRAFCAGIMFILGMILVTDRDKRKYMYYGLFILCSVAVALAIFKKLPNRITLPITLFAVLYCLYHFLDSFVQGSIKLSKWKWLIAIAIFIVFVKIVNFRAIFREMKYSKENYVKACSDLDKISQEGKVIIIPGFEHFFEGIPMFKDPREYYRNNYIFTAWTIFTPAYNQMINKLGVNNLMMSLYKDDKFYITEVKPEYIKDFIKEHYNENVVVKDLKGDFKLFKPIEVSITRK
jgi:hypothetical protein